MYATASQGRPTMAEFDSDLWCRHFVNPPPVAYMVRIKPPSPLLYPPFSAVPSPSFLLRHSFLVVSSSSPLPDRSFSVVPSPSFFPRRPFLIICFSLFLPTAPSPSRLAITYFLAIFAGLSSSLSSCLIFLFCLLFAVTFKASWKYGASSSSNLPINVLSAASAFR